MGNYVAIQMVDFKTKQNIKEKELSFYKINHLLSYRTLIIIGWLMVYLENRTYLLLVGLFFELIGGTLLAFEMIGVLDKIKKWNLSLHDKIEAKRKEFVIDLASAGLIVVIIFFFLDYVKKELSLKEIFFLIYSISIFCIFFQINSVIFKLLDFIEYLTKKLGTKKVIGLFGVVFLCLGFIIQFYINLTTK